MQRGHGRELPNAPKRPQAQIDSGVRIARTNAKGEREILDDAARAVEAKRHEGVIARDCNGS
jgi:hypothetical protein